MSAFSLALALLAAQASPTPAQHFTITIPEVGIYNTHAPLLNQEVVR